eukprot:g9073.t1
MWMLLINATRGQAMGLSVVKEAPTQVFMGDLQTLVLRKVEAADATKPLCRLFLLLGPPMAKGLGDMDDLVKCMPSSVDLADDFASLLVD